MPNEQSYYLRGSLPSTSSGTWPFDELRVDHGQELLYLMLYIHDKLREQCGNPDIVPYRQTPSTHNHIIERIWVELNQVVTYQLKGILIAMVESGTRGGY